MENLKPPNELDLSYHHSREMASVEANYAAIYRWKKKNAVLFFIPLTKLAGMLIIQ